MIRKGFRGKITQIWNLKGVLGVNQANGEGVMVGLSKEKERVDPGKEREGHE